MLAIMSGKRHDESMSSAASKVLEFAGRGADLTSTIRSINHE